MKNKYKDIKEFFAKNLPHLKASESLMRKLREFRLDWSTKSDDYIDFLGSKLLGVHMIRFSDLDNDKLMVDTLHIRNWKDLQEEIYLVKDMEKNFKIGSDIIYQTLAYIAHLFITDKKLNNRIKENGVREACLIMQYRMFSSLYSWYFKYSTTETIATTVYNRLSHKYLIKQLPNWQKVFEYRVENCLDKKSPNYKKLIKFTTVDAIRIVSDIQTKLREQVKQIYKILIDILEKKEVMEVENSTYTGGENNEEQIRDNTTGKFNYITNMKNIIFNRNEIIDENLIKFIDRIVPNIDETLLKNFIICVSELKDEKEKKEIYTIVEDVILISLEYLQRLNLNIEKREYIPKAITNIKNYWSSSKVTVSRMKDIKDYIKELAYQCTGKKTSWLLVSLTIGYITYIFARSLKK